MNAFARQSDPDTAQDAARSLTGQLTTLEKLCLQEIEKSSAGLTSHEIAQLTGLHLVTVSPRLRPLSDKGRIADSGVRRVGSSGRASIVWIVA